MTRHWRCWREFSSPATSRQQNSHASSWRGVALTKREVECLRWAGAGKTNDDIAIILGLKRTTIRFHIRSAAQKLDAVNRDQALFKAAQLGFLGKVR
ncbi:helix-turn-helix transcriptional regulator [Sphingomonas sp. H160509]|uniref:response regulator transcription factor n=1 Tax=Sphingomonas sp. H160509 TaxID=2955313 RepID=UPI002098001A|nr:helix-turn-helix transcriptional regulator [Sphingomonas sp. H160509]MDD1451359.1 helix-turn-helix transcriptional regulator [Sphingomonas sp. H160509]